MVECLDACLDARLDSNLDSNLDSTVATGTETGEGTTGRSNFRLDLEYVGGVDRELLLGRDLDLDCF